MNGLSWALLLKPLVYVVIFGLICLPARLAVGRFMRDGKLKRALLTDIRPK